tara:strand:- start:3530 stop:4543 length:1014 start_codon:yes stop_codon:yes gene_type:complete
MNKFTKMGVSALCGSLAIASAANAGSMSVAGSANATWTSLDGAVTGNPLGMTTGMTFTGSGELDNGNTFTVNIAHDDKNTYSASDISVVVAGIGTIALDQGGGTGLDRLDDKMPTAWEEADGTGVGAGLQTVVGVGGQTDIEWAIDSSYLPDGMSAYISWSPVADGAKNNDKASSGATTDGLSTGSGYDLVFEHSGLADGLNIFAGYGEIEQPVVIGDRVTKVAGFTYAIGSVTVGYQKSKDDAPGVVGTTTSYYENDAYGISFAVNDNLSVSYGKHESVQQNDAENTEVSAESFQVAYSMGGATVKMAETEVNNASYSTAAGKDKEGRTIALTLAF